jgi:hypothetical protein
MSARLFIYAAHSLAQQQFHGHITLKSVLPLKDFGAS